MCMFWCREERRRGFEEDDVSDRSGKRVINSEHTQRVGVERDHSSQGQGQARGESDVGGRAREDRRAGGSWRWRLGPLGLAGRSTSLNGPAADADALLLFRGQQTSMPIASAVLCRCRQTRPTANHVFFDSDCLLHKNDTYVHLHPVVPATKRYTKSGVFHAHLCASSALIWSFASASKEPLADYRFVRHNKRPDHLFVAQTLLCSGSHHNAWRYYLRFIQVTQASSARHACWTYPASLTTCTTLSCGSLPQSVV